MYEIPAYGPADLHSGDEIAPVELTGGSFIRVTNSVPSRLPQEGSIFRQPFVADDNHDVSIDDNGNTIAFVSTRDLVTGGNPFPAEDNDEIFTYVHSGSPTFADYGKLDPAQLEGERSSNDVESKALADWINEHL